MSAGSQQIVCRRCNEVISVEEAGCPHCGTSIRSNLPFFAAIAFGVLMIASTLFNPSELLAFGVVGLLLAGGAGYLYYEKRQRMQRAAERSSGIDADIE